MKASFTLSLTALGLLILPGLAPAQMLVNLERWEGQAVLLPHRGPGEDYFRLDAVADWTDEAPRDSARYLTEITLADGRVLRRQLAPGQGPLSHRLSFYVPARAVLNLRPNFVFLQAAVLDRQSGRRVSEPLMAQIDDFPHPGAIGPKTEEGPFHWGRPLAGEPGQPRRLTRRGPDGLLFVRIPETEEGPGFYLATTEVTNRQARDRLPDYDPDAGRSDEFQLSAPDQPAIGLTPAMARQYLANLSSFDDSGLVYRLPTRDEWLRAARAGHSSAFWWGDKPTHPEGANFLGPEPALATESTAPSRPRAFAGKAHFQANPWGLYHTFGNVAEWATTPEGGFVRLGGHFRTEPASPLPEVAVDGPDQVGPDPYVSLRPAFSLEAADAADLIGKVLEDEIGPGNVRAVFNPDRGTVILTGLVPDFETRRRVSNLAASLWFVNAVTDQLTMPSLDEGVLVELGPGVGEPRRISPLGRVYDIYPVAAKWAGRLPVSGSKWYMNVYLPGGEHYAHPLLERQPGGDTVDVLIDHSRLPAGGLGDELEINVGISLGVPAGLPTDTNLVSNLAPLRIRLR